MLLLMVLFVVSTIVANVRCATKMKLSKSQIDLLKKLECDPDKGLSPDEVSARREQDDSFNVVEPPIKCPGWICCLLPCIKSIPSMKIFRSIKPEDAEVLRDGQWIRYDASSLVAGDIIRLEEGDIVPADCVVLRLEDGTTELLVDHRYVTGEDKPRSARIVPDPTANSRSSNKNVETVVQATQLYWGGQVVQGSALAAVTAIGPKTLVASLIKSGRFPPKDVVLEASIPNVGMPSSSSSDEEQQGISLVTNN